ncbi:MAG: arsenate reductase (glutaredoxin) [Planctomycetota bacterium]
MSQEITIYHNPRCSKSRQTLALLEEAGATPNIVLYLEAPPSAKELGAIVDRLGIEPLELMRKKEAPFKELGFDEKAPDRQAALQAMHEHPILIERPIVVKGDRAIIGRPPENVQALL